MTKRETDVAQNDLDVIIETGTILMEGGAEIYRVEETMRHMAAALRQSRHHRFWYEQARHP